MIKKKNRAIFLPSNIPKLQSLIKRDPESYKEDFFIQWRHYETIRDILIENTGEKNEDFQSLIMFMSQICSYYPKETRRFPNDMATLLLNFQNNLHNETKDRIIQALVLLRNKNIISSSYLLKVIFPILSSLNTKSLHIRIFKTILSEIKNANLKSHNNKINRLGKTVLLEMMQKSKEDESSLGIWTVKLCKKLWKLRIWNDAFTIEIIKEAIFHSNTKVIISGVHFFLDIDASSSDSDSDIEDNQKNIASLNHKLSVNKKTKKRERELLKAINIKKKKDKKEELELHNLDAIQLLHNPQGFAEKIFSKYFSKKNTNLILEHKLLLLQLLSKLIGIHKLNILGIYTFLLKYLNPNQKKVTYFISCAAHACHDLIPPDDIEPIIEKIANEFINDSVSSEIICVGLNAIRAICSKQPLAIKKELLQSLSEYKKSKYKGVMMAARSLIKLYREIAPEFLKKKDRGELEISINKKESLEFYEESDSRKNIEEIGSNLIKKNKYNTNIYYYNNKRKQMNKKIGINLEELISFDNSVIIEETKNSSSNFLEIKQTEYTNNQKTSETNFQEILVEKETKDTSLASMIFNPDFSKFEEFELQRNVLTKKNQNLKYSSLLLKISITELVDKFKLNGKFDSLRKEILTIYKNSDAGLQLKSKLEEIINNEINNNHNLFIHDRGKAAVVISNIIDKSDIYNHARELMNNTIFMNKEFRERINIIIQEIKDDLEKTIETKININNTK
ncbi:hypothetical protein PORY_002790 [Pneumocystis oryctolagi]|uniref:Uncharacterized protein n=1 Tax=Pneumocystis oryctolagi TaxID=42067 RepID=A0ACB7C8Y6_9ASCO|nr:hypothetical protein PORY_002790 [Pneumocystis oryctolagi]